MPRTNHESDVPLAKTAAAPPPARLDEALAGTFYRDLVWSMRNGVLAIRRDGSIALINDVAYRVLGLQPNPDDLGRAYPDVLGDIPEISQVLADAFDLNHLPNRAELRLRRSGRVIGYTLTRIFDGDGDVSGAALFFKDLTRVERLEERERLRDRLAALGEMAAAIAHEVKNPLAGIQVTAGLLKRQLADSDDAQALLSDIISEAATANTIVVDVLEFVRPLSLQVERTSVPQVLDDAVTRASGHAARGSISIDTHIDTPVPDIQGDHTQLRQLFTNLVINAFEALEGQGQIDVTATHVPGDDSVGTLDHAEKDGFVVIDVTDDGPGIPIDVTEKIFSPFFTTKPRGSGLGLAIVRKVVDAHDGRIDVTAPPDGGTRFRITLPVAGTLEDLRPADHAGDRPVH